MLRKNNSLPTGSTAPGTALESTVLDFARPGAPKAPQAETPSLIYVVENDRISSVITELIVQKSLHGGQVRCFANGQLAFNQLTAAFRDGAPLPDLILLDLDMPLMDGWEFLEALACFVPPVPTRVFVLTSSIHPDDLAKATSYPEVKGFFTKPLGEASVVRMRQLLREGPGIG